MNKVGYTSCPDMSELTCLWAARVTCFSHHWWFSLMSLDLSQWYIYNDTNDVIIEVLVCLQGIFFNFFSLSTFSLLNTVFFEFCNLKKFLDDFCDSQITYIIHNSLNYIISLNIFLYIVLSLFFSMLVSKNSPLRQPIEIPRNWKVKKG